MIEKQVISTKYNELPRRKQRGIEPENAIERPCIRKDSFLSAKLVDFMECLTDKILSLIIFIMVLVVCSLSLPSRSKHGEAISKSFKEEHSLLGKVGAGIVYSKILTYKEYYVCSIMLENGQIKSVGAAGIVIVL